MLRTVLKSAAVRRLQEACGKPLVGAVQSVSAQTYATAPLPAPQPDAKVLYSGVSNGDII